MKNIIKIIDIRKITLLVSLILLLTSCEDYLQDELLSDTSVDFLYSSPEGLETAIVGLYTFNRTLFERVDQNGAIPIILQSKSDLVVGVTGEISLYSRLSWGATLGDYGTRSAYSSYWKHYYKLVDRSNAIIKAAQEMQNIDESQKSRIIGEAKAFRAYAYFTLYRLFNNIYITTEPTTPENAFDVPDNKSSVEEIFSLIKSDLTDAITNLEWTTGEFGRWTQAAARHLRADVALWEQDWSEAANQADEIINNGSYSLESSTKDVFKGSLSKNETLLAIQFERDAIGGGKRNYINWNLIPTYGSAPGCLRSIENGGSGAGFLVMNDYLRNLLKEDPNDDRDDKSYYISYYQYNDPSTLPAGKQVGDTLDLYDQYSSDRTEFTNYYRRMNPGCLKYFDENAEPTDRSHYKNMMVYRLAETYLIGAEAHMRLGNDTKALEYLNTVRERAHAAPKTTIDQQTILDERARELAFEGGRWYTLKRMGVFLSQLQQYMGNDNWNAVYSSGDPRVLIQEHMKNWAIPEEQLNLLGPNYPQNEGY